MNRSPIEEALIIERYKYILGQKKKLNERTFKIASVYQASVLVIATGQFHVVADAGMGRLGKRLALDASWGLLLLFILVTALMAALVVGGVLAWVGYRKDEAEIELAVQGRCRTPPHWRDLFTWYESYILVAGAVGVMAYSAAIFWKIIPAICAG